MFLSEKEKRGSYVVMFFWIFFLVAKLCISLEIQIGSSLFCVSEKDFTMKQKCIDHSKFYTSYKWKLSLTITKLLQNWNSKNKSYKVITKQTFLDTFKILYYLKSIILDYKTETMLQLTFRKNGLHKLHSGDEWISQIKLSSVSPFNS